VEKYLVFDIGGTNVKYGILTDSGKILEKNHLKTAKSWKEMRENFDQIISKRIDKISGLAFSAPGRIDVEKGIIYEGGAVTYLDQVNVKKYFKERYGLKSTVINDGKAAGQAELWKGNLKGVKDALSMTLGTGIGGAVIVDGKIHQGRNFVAGEFSSLMPLGQSFDTTLSDTNSAVGLIANLAKEMALKDLQNGKKVFEKLDQGENEKANKIFKNYCKRLAITIANIQIILDISDVVIGGGISNQPLLIEELRNQYALLRRKHPVIANLFEPLRINRCKFSNDSNLLGALYQFLLENDAL
ncbi:MAG: ROK family protein, partial [Atopostipes suicloacalis]|nr:ROK family protein [Atopostipes suicloacalis]